MALPRKPTRYLVVLALLITISFFFFRVPALSELSEDANPGFVKNEKGTAVMPDLAPGVGPVIDSHRGESRDMADFPAVIHQTGKKNVVAPATMSWYYANPGEQHAFYSDSDANKFVQDHASSEIYGIYSSLFDVVARADLFRYLILREKGGVYADMDTTALCPINAWIPAEFDVKDIGLVIGIEVDMPSVTSTAEIEEWGWAANFQFVQWTAMAKPGHQVFINTIREVLKRISALAEERSQTVRNLKLSQLDIIKTTGPGPFTASVLSYLGLTDASTLRGLTKPLLVKDVLIMPVTSFAPNQRHSKSKSVKYVENIPEVLVMHGFQSTRNWADSVKEWLVAQKTRAFQALPR